MSYRTTGKPEPGRPTTGMLHRRCPDTCPLHGVWGVPWDPADRSTWGRQHVHAEALWAAAAADGRRGWEHRVVAAAAELGVACAPEEARRHFLHHRIEQPMMSGYLDREGKLAEALDLAPVAQQLLVAVYRARVLTLDQITEAFFADGRTAGGARWKAATITAALCRSHFLYRFYPDPAWPELRGQPPQFAKQAMYFLGKAAVPFIEAREGRKVWPGHYIEMAKEVHAQPRRDPATGRWYVPNAPHERFIHDLRCNALWCSLHRALRERRGLVEVPEALRGLAGTDLLACEAKVENWYGPKDLALGFKDPSQLGMREMQPDGFASLSVHRSAWGAASLPSCQLPFFIEYDRGSRQYRGSLNERGVRDERKGVVEQLLSYHRLALLRKAGARFPQLAVDGYAVPVIMVFSDRGRMRGVHRAFQAYAVERGFRGEGSPIFFVCEEDWNADPFAPGIMVSAWHEFERGLDLLELLLRASRKLIAARGVFAGTVLTIDRAGAKRLSVGAMSPSRLERSREKRADLRDAKRRAERAAAYLTG